MNSNRPNPFVGKISILLAIILLVYALTPFIRLPEKFLVIRFSVILFSIKLNFFSLASFLAAGLAAVGTGWLVEFHPKQDKKNAWFHWIIPAITAWLIGLPLSSIDVSRQWWIVFGLGSLLLIFVILAEYTVVDLDDPNQPLATAGLTAVSMAIFLTLAISIKAANIRLFLAAPIILATGIIFSVRALFLRLEGKWKPAWAMAIGFTVCQVGIGLHYLPLSPLQYGLILVSVLYGLISFAGEIEEGRTRRYFWVEPVAMGLILWVLAGVIG